MHTLLCLKAMKVLNLCTATLIQQARHQEPWIMPMTPLPGGRCNWCCTAVLSKRTGRVVNKTWPFQYVRQKGRSPS